jgi:hypothetical protein
MIHIVYIILLIFFIILITNLYFVLNDLHKREVGVDDD